MATRITVKEALEYHGYDDIFELQFASVIPACCSEGCEVEPDGICQHGNPSVLITLGMI